MTEYVGQKPLFDQYLDLKAENERLRKLVAELPKCFSCGGIIKHEQGGQCMPCLGEENLPDSAPETRDDPTRTPSGRPIRQTICPSCAQYICICGDAPSQNR